MTTTFDTLTKLTAVNALIAEYHSYASKETEADFVEMYNEDANDFMQALSYFRQSDTAALVKHINCMDTEPRESLVMAFYKDLSDTFVQDVLGYVVN
jgi:hypothetical protein